MTTKALRNIVTIDEEKCNGCGACVIACAEGALQIINGKAKLISEIYCDGLGACLGECPQGAITVEVREADEFDEEATEHHLEHATDVLACGCPSTTVTQFERAETADVAQGDVLPCGCPSSTVTQFEGREAAGVAEGAIPSMLGHWPVQLTLVPPTAPFLKGADLVMAADCVPFAYAGFHQRFLKDHSLLVACPKLDDYQAHLKKLTDVLRQSQVKSLTVVHMEVPCCFGLVQMVEQAVQASGRHIPFHEVTIGIRGDIVEEVCHEHQ